MGHQSINAGAKRGLSAPGRTCDKYDFTLMDTEAYIFQCRLLRPFIGEGYIFELNINWHGSLLAD
jgi:hypothetical protein